MRFLIIFLLLPFYVSSQVYYEGFSPYILGHKQDTTNAILVDNTEDGFVGYYIVKQGDTVKFHLDTANLLLLHTDTSFRIEFDSLYLDTLVYGRGKYLLTWDDVTKQVFALDTLSFSDSLYFLFSSDNSPTGWYYSGDTVEIDTTDTGGADSLYFWYTDTIGVTDWYFPGDTILIDTSGSTILYDTLVDGFGIKYFRYTPSMRDTVEADSLDLDDWFVTDTLFSYTVDSIFTYVNDSLYSYLYDTLYISLSDTMFSYFYDTLYNTLYDSLFVNISDSLFVYFYDSVYNTLYDSLYIYLYDSLYINLYDSLFISVTDSIYSYFYDSLYVTLYDSLYIHLYDSLFISVTDSIYSYFYDSLFISLTDSLIIYINDSLGGIDSTYVEFTDYHSPDGWYGTGDSLRIDTTDMIGDTSLWEITVGDTIDTKGFNIRLDSSFAMVYNNDYFGYDPEKTKTKTIYNQIKWGDTVMYHVMQATPGSFIHNLFTGEPTSTNGGLNMGWYPGITDTMIEVLLYSTDNFVVSAIYVTPQRIRLLTDDTIVLEADRGVYLRLKRLSNPNAPFVIDTLPQSSKQFLMSWDSASGQVYVIDTTGWKGGSEDSLYFLKSDSWFDNGWYRNDTIQVDTGYWTLNGNHLYPNNTTDSVIIGGTSPGEILEVTGNIRLSDGNNRKIYVEKSTVLGADGYNLEIYAGNSNDPGEAGTGKGGDVIIHGGTGDGGGSPAGGNVFIYPINQDQDGSLFLNLDTDTLSSDTRIYLGGVYTKDNTTDSVLVLSRDHTLSWLSKDSLMTNAGDSCLWEIIGGDTIDTKGYNIKLDSGFQMRYKGNFFGYGDPYGNGWNILGMVLGDGAITIDTNQKAIGIGYGSASVSVNSNGIGISSGNGYLFNMNDANEYAYIYTPGGLGIMLNDTIDAIEITTDSIKFITPETGSGDYFLVWNSTDSLLYAMDTTGYKGGGGGIGGADSIYFKRSDQFSPDGWYGLADTVLLDTTDLYFGANSWVDDIAFDYPDITMGISQTYILDIKASYQYVINSAILETDDGTLTGVAIKIDGTNVTGLSSVTVDTGADETSASAANSVEKDSKVTLVTSVNYTGSPTVLRGKLKITRFAVADSITFVDDIAFEFRDVIAGVDTAYTLDIKGTYTYDITSAILETDNGTLDSVVVKINSTAVTGLDDITVDTGADETSATAANSVALTDRVYIYIGEGYTGTPTLIRGKLKLKRT
jgi:hypothetical protein